MMDEETREKLRRMFIARSLAQCIYAMPGGECGGPLHIVLDDGNVSDEDLMYCFDYMKKDECQKNFDPDLIYLCQLCAKMLLELNEAERERVVE